VHGHRRRQLRLGEPEGLQQCKIPPAAAHRSRKGEPKGDDRTCSETPGEEDRRYAHRTVVDYLCRPQDRHHSDGATSTETVRHGGEGLGRGGGDPAHVRQPGVITDTYAHPYKDEFWAVESCIGLCQRPPKRRRFRCLPGSKHQSPWTVVTLGAGEADRGHRRRTTM